MRANPDRAVEELEISWKRLARCWSECQDSWKDAARKEFEEQYWNPLSDEIRLTLKGMQSASEVIRRAQQNAK